MTLTTRAMFDLTGQDALITGASPFFASDAASFVTGQTIVVDGGATIGTGR